MLDRFELLDLLFSRVDGIYASEAQLLIRTRLLREMIACAHLISHETVGGLNALHHVARHLLRAYLLAGQFPRDHHLGVLFWHLLTGGPLRPLFVEGKGSFGLGSELIRGLNIVVRL